jgi:hypothetical protein
MERGRVRRRTAGRTPFGDGFTSNVRRCVLACDGWMAEYTELIDEVIEFKYS